MTNEVIFRDLGLIPFGEAWNYQRNLMEQVQQIKLSNRTRPVNEWIAKHNYLLFCEHPHVFTLGKSGEKSNLLVSQDFLKQKKAEFFRIDRGGDITYHGPGQIVGYPIFDLEDFGMGVKQYISNIEEAIILTLESYGIKSGRLKDATGVWLDSGMPGKTRKICAIGVKVSRGITMHGFAFNVNTDLGYYQFINPCGFVDKGVTSMEKELGRKIEMNEVKQNLGKQFASIFRVQEVYQQ